MNDKNRSNWRYLPTPKPAGNARVIAKWPTKEKSTLNGIGRLHKGPIQAYRVW